ncbi:DNA polymerase delta subunit 3-like [Chironomus tepperi]|uniref:DNA polymerase delta subunit 3-like n=1 Tax=Chironomus tepperi TaxID=113505 RepID=UPI00391F192C
MESSIEKSCLEEISANVFDSMQKVTLKTISNNWQVSNAVAKDVLSKWLKQNEKKLKELVKEFVIQGINTKGTFAISVVPEDKKEKLAKIWKNFDSWLYSIETKSNSKSLDLPVNFEPIQVKNLQVNLGNRDLQIAVKQEPSTSQTNTTKIKTPFGMVKPLDKKEIKKEKVDVVVKKEEETEKVKIVDPVKEELPPKVSPESKSSNVKSNAKKGGNKNQPAAQGKASISSFFSKPSNKNSTDKQSPTSSESSTIKKEPEIKVEKKEEVTRKRSASPEIQKKEPAKKVPNKKLKLKDPPNKKRSRIQVMEDSSEEEEVEPQIEDLPDSKFIKFDREMTPEKKELSPKEEMDVDEEVVESKKEETKKGHKNKAKRWVTKRFETDDGFIRTEKVLEEYSDDEDENKNENNDDNIKKNSQSQEKTESPPNKKTPQKKVTPKTKVKDMPKTKQGSIMNFFTKK